MQTLEDVAVRRGGGAGLRIGEVAVRAGTTTKAIRHYEAIGLLRPAQRTRNGYRLYEPVIVDELRFVARGKALGLALDEIKDLMETARVGQAGPLRAKVVLALDKKLDQHQQRIAELVARRNALTGHRRLAMLAAASPACECHGFAVECPCLPADDAGV